MDNRIKSSLQGKELRINWRSPKKMVEVQEASSKLQDDLANAYKVDESLTKEEKVKALEKGVKKGDKILAEYYKKTSDIMFDFLGDEPNWEDEDFPQGEFEYNQALFFNPTKKM